MKKKKAVLIFDLDQTLFDTVSFIRDNSTLLKKHGISKRRSFAAVRERFATEPFHPKKYIDALFTLAHQRKKALKDFFGLLREPERYWYSGVEDFLHKLKKEHTLILVTYGHRNFQLKKIGTYSRFFEKIIVTKKKDKEADLQKIKKIFPASAHCFFDDKRIPVKAARSLGMHAFRVKKSPKDRQYFEALHKKIISATWK